MTCKTILIAEDDEGISEGLCEIAKQMGHEVHAVTNRTSLETFLSTQPKIDLALVDLHLNDISGEDVVKKIRNQSSNSSALVYLFSGSDNVAHFAEAINADGFLTKPANIDEIISIFQNLSPT